jgi:hypothetical protein
MPLDSKGKFRSSTQRAIAADRGMGKDIERKAPPAIAPAPAPESEAGGEEGPAHTIYPHEDGSFHSISADGERTDHPHAGHAAAHFMAQHGEGGPNDGLDLEELGEALKRFFDEQAEESY